MKHKFHPNVFSCFSTLRGKQQQKFVLNFKKSKILNGDKSECLVKKLDDGSGSNNFERGLKEDDQKLDTKVGLKVGRWLKVGQWLKVGRWLRTLFDWQGLLLLQLCTLGVQCSEVG